MSSNKPFPSSDLDVFKENSLILDHFVNSQDNEYPDRFNRKRPTITGIIKEAFDVRTDISNMNETLIGQSRWDVVPKNTSLSLGGDNGALNKQAQALFNRTIMLKIQTREALRRSYQEVGLILHDGSFEEGATINNPTDVLLEEKTGKVYSWTGSFPFTVIPGSKPNQPEWEEVGTTVITGILGKQQGASKIGKNAGGSVQDHIDEITSGSGAVIVGYNAGRGGSKRSVRARLKDRLNVADFKVDTDSDWTRAFQRAAESGETVSMYVEDGFPGLFEPVYITAPTTFYCEGGFKQPIAKAHTGGMFVIESSGVNISDLTVYNDETLGKNGRTILLNSTKTPLETIRIKNIVQQGGTNTFISDNGGTNLIVDLLLEDIKLQGIMSTGIALTKVFAYLDMKKITVNYVPSASKAFIGISITGNEGANLEWCHVNHGITAAVNNSYGFAFANCKALWLDRCQADTCGIDGFRFDSCQYVYGNGLSASLCGGDGIVLSGSDFTIGNSYFGGRKGLPYSGIANSALVRNKADRAFFNDCILSNGQYIGYTSDRTGKLSSGCITNTTTPYAVTGLGKIRQVMNDAGGLFDFG